MIINIKENLGRNNRVYQANTVYEVSLSPPEEQAPQVCRRNLSTLLYLVDQVIPGHQAIVGAVVLQGNWNSAPPIVW